MSPYAGKAAKGYALRVFPRSTEPSQTTATKEKELQLSTVGVHNAGIHPRVKVQSAGWVKIQSAQTLDAFRWGPWGWVDFRGLTKSGQMRFSGWAASIDDGGIQAVAVDQEGTRAEYKTNVERPDVESAYDDPRFRSVGWESLRPTTAVGDDSFLEVTAIGANGEQALLYAGPALDPKLKWNWFSREIFRRVVSHVVFRFRGRFG